MLGFKINNEDLKLLPGTVLEVERNNPFVQFNETMVGEFSYPFEFAATPENVRLTKYAPLLQKKVDNTGIDVTCYDNEFQDSVGKLKFEKVTTDLNRTQNGRISAYYLTGLSYFNSDLKGKRLRDIDCGGDRTFAWDFFTRNGNGFWGHIHKVLDAPAGYGTSGFDYAFYPLINKNFTWQAELEEVGGDLLNNMQYNSGTLVFANTGTDNNDANKIVPFLYLRYVLKQIEAYTGWKFEGEVLEDEDLLKITLFNSRAIDWAIYIPSLIALGAQGYVGRLEGVKFNLIDHLPDVSISEFLMAIRNRFGLSFDVDRKSRTVNFKKLVSVAATNVKDVTGKASPIVTKTVLTEKKIYSLTTSEDSGAINLSGVEYQGEIANVSNLPLATEDKYQHVYLVQTENNYYICEQKEDANVWEWHILDYNTRDVVPEGATEEISTAALTTGVEKYNAYLDLLPRYDEFGWWPGRTEENDSTTIMLLFYHGIRTNKVNQPYPFASSHIYDSKGVQVGNWSLSFLGKKTDGTDVGLYALNWKPFLDKLTTGEELSVTLYLSRNDFMQLKFSDLLSIDGVRMYIAKMKHTIPYSGQVQCDCTRV